MKKLVMVFPLALGLAGCPLMETIAPTTPAASGASSVGSMVGFLNKLESTRGTALSVVEKASVTAAVGQTRNMIDGAQNKFLGSVSQFTGLDTAVLGVLMPQATQSLSQNEVLSKVETKLGRKLGVQEAAAAKAATTLRNNSLSSLKSGLANQVGKAVGLDGNVVQALLPLAGL